MDENTTDNAQSSTPDSSGPKPNAEPFEKGPGQGNAPEASLGFFDRLRASGWHLSSNRKIIGGVCAGVSDKLGIDPIITRGIAVMLLIFGGLAIPLYGLAWLLLPDENTGRTLFEDARYGNASPLLAVPILLLVIGFFSVFPIGTALLGLLGLGFFPMTHLAIPTLNSIWPAMDYEPPRLLQVALILCVIAVVCGCIFWVCTLIYKQKYTLAAKSFSIIGIIALIGSICELILSEALGEYPIFPLFSRSFAGLMIVFPLAILAFFFSWIIGRNRTPAGYINPTSNSSPAFAAPGNHPHPEEHNSGSTLANPYTATGFTPRETSGGFQASLGATMPPPANQATQPIFPADEKTSGPAAFPQNGWGGKRPRIAGPTPAFNMSVGGLIMLAIVGGILLGGFWLNPGQAILLCIGLITVILSGAMFILAVNRRRTSWLSWVSALVVVCITLPATSLAAVVPELKDTLFKLDWETIGSAFDGEERALNPGDSLAAIDANYVIDLRDNHKTGDINANFVSGDVSIFLNPHQAVDISISLIKGEVKLSSMSQWYEPETNTKKDGFFDRSTIDKNRARYLSLDGNRRVTFTDRTLDVIPPSRHINIDSKVKLRNAAARENKHTQRIKLQFVSGNVNIFERPTEIIWNGEVLPDGHFRINYWLDMRSVQRFPESETVLPTPLRKRGAKNDSLLGGKRVGDYGAEGETDSLATLAEVQNGALGQWKDVNHDGFNDLYQPGGSAWREGDTLYNPQTGKPVPYDAQQGNSQTNPPGDSSQTETSPPSHPGSSEDETGPEDSTEHAPASLYEHETSKEHMES